jgi:hypothetical protein
MLQSLLTSECGASNVTMSLYPFNEAMTELILKETNQCKMIRNIMEQKHAPVSVDISKIA